MRHSVSGLGILVAAALVTTEAAAQLSPASGTASSSLVPLRPGLIVVSAVFTEERGDYESTKSITATNDQQVRIHYTGQQVRINRIVRRSDLALTRALKADFNNDDDDAYPGTTAISTSTLVLQELLLKGEAAFEMEVDESGPHHGVLERVAGPATMSMIVNDERVDLPVVHARGKLDGDAASIVFLNDPTNALVLQFRFLNRKLDVVRIAYPIDKSRIESALATTKRAVVYGIYFDFASDQMQPESEPVLKEIADALRKNPGWSLSIAGHTDNIGRDTDNQVLSHRRAAAVKQALVKRYGISERRLNTTGFGESHPVDTNDTLQGRARNRRVELVRM